MGTNVFKKTLMCLARTKLFQDCQRIPIQSSFIEGRNVQFPSKRIPKIVNFLY